MTTTFTGIYAACITPFSSDGAEIDIAGISAQVEHMISNGVHGLVPGGSTGEFTALTVAERKACNRAYIEAAAGRVPVVAGTGALSTAETIELSRDAEEAGADALMIVPPFYGTPSFEEILVHYRAISDVVDIPIMFYNIPDATGLELSAEEFGRLGREGRVANFKDTSGDFSKFTSVYLNHSDDIQPINGCDTLTFAALALGTGAGVWGSRQLHSPPVHRSVLCAGCRRRHAPGAGPVEEDPSDLRLPRIPQLRLRGEDRGRARRAAGRTDTWTDSAAGLGAS